jgi:hypothetical protein
MEGYCSGCAKTSPERTLHVLESSVNHHLSFSKEVDVPTQFGKFKLIDSEGNQCSWCAHQFLLRSPQLVEAIELEDIEAGAIKFLAAYEACLSSGSSKRQAHCATGLALPVGENVDDPTIMEISRIDFITRGLSEGLHNPSVSVFKVIASSSNSIFNQQRSMLPMMFPTIAARLLAATDESRHGLNVSANDFRADLISLSPCGACILERHLEAMTIIRTSNPDIQSNRAFLICDSHYPRSGLTNIEGVLNYVFRLIPQMDFPLTYAVTQNTK